ncbi:hypothetical protein NIM87_14015 [Devosia sp. XJ19-1]|uniref:Uncharacterized protein n=1 Tax=Devosia ureilytica TaxID=2952754 RepID=A0A9Q4AQ23_9HYPH|nr:hypothetical protein [Devosia ureilytica]MCP8884629.1 hypothetical protein [Devosia ureilytica]MCP8888259.1 hypothetical protein [Devosia ureilytica]
MADYKELLRRAISALPENNGAARRAVYEKARSALVGQLRAIQPPLPARDITQHRLQLEDCIRQVEQEASEAVISLGRDGPLAARPAPDTPALNVRPTPPPQPQPQPKLAEVSVASEAKPPATSPEAEPTPKPVEPAPAAVPVEAPPEPKSAAPEEPVKEPGVETPSPRDSIESIIAQAAQTSGAVLLSDDKPAKTDAPVAPVEDKPTRPLTFTPRPPASSGNTQAVSATTVAPRIEPMLGSTALASQPVLTEPVIIEPPLPVDPALSSVREVEIEQDDARAAEGAIERAIETLDREARGEATEPPPEREDNAAVEASQQDEDAGFAPVGAERRSGAGLTIFLIVFVVLLAGVGGAGFWAWREGYVDLDQMFGRTQTAVTQPVTTTEPASLPTMDSAATPAPTDTEGASGPGNTATTAATEPTSALEVTDEDRLEPTPEAVTPTGNETVLPSIDGETKTEERLSGEDTSIAATEDPAASVDPAVLAGNQSLLLEASTNGQGGAVPFSGTVEWTQGSDEIGLPTLQAQASIPARNLGVSIIIRKNNDPVLPASHLMEISFDVPDTFIGGSIATLAGVLLKDEELVPGTALAGAAARVVGNSFLFALSASPSDLTTNTNLLGSRRWLDLAIVYGTGRNAILTLEKDEEAEALFDTVLAAWAE